MIFNNFSFNETSFAIRDAVEKGISSKKIDPVTLKMLLFKPDSSFSTITILAQHDWDDYAFQSYKNQIPIGSVSLIGWQTELSTALENNVHLNPEWAKKAQKIKDNSLNYKPVLKFKDLLTKENEDYLLCVRSWLLEGLKNIIIELATKHFYDTFSKLVAFSLFKAEYTTEEDLQIVALANPKSEGPFYYGSLIFGTDALASSVKVFVKPKSQGFVLFHLEDRSMNEYGFSTKGVLEIDSRNLEQGVYELDCGFFRLSGQKNQWYLSLDSRIGSRDEKLFEGDFQSFIDSAKKDFSDLSKVPNPATHEEHFNQWIAHIENNNIHLNENVLIKIMDLNYPVLQSIVQKMSLSALSYPYVVVQAAEEMLKEEKYNDTIDFLESQLKLNPTNELEWHRNIPQHIYLLLVNAASLAGNDTVLYRYFEMLDSDWTIDKASIYKWMYEVHTSKNNTLELDKVKNEIESFLEMHKNSGSSQNYGWIGLAYLGYSTDNLMLTTQSLSQINYAYDVIPPFISTVYQREPELLQLALKEIEFAKAHAKAMYDLKNLHIKAVGKPLKAPAVPDNTYFFYVQKEIETEKFIWVYAVTDKVFIACTKTDTLLVLEFTNDEKLQELQRIQLESVISYAFQDSVLYITCYHEGIHIFTFQQNRLNEVELVRNTNRHAKYKGLAIQNDLLYATNFNRIEIFKITDGSLQFTGQEIYLGENAFYLFAKNDLLLADIGSGQYVLVKTNSDDKTSIVSKISEFRSGESNYVHWSGNYLIGPATINIENPEAPVLVGVTSEEIAPCYNFSELYPSDCYSSDGRGIIKIIQENEDFNQGQPIFNCYKANKKEDCRLFYCLATVLTDNQLLLFNKKQFVVLGKTAK